MFDGPYTFDGRLVPEDPGGELERYALEIIRHLKENIESAASGRGRRPQVNMPGRDLSVRVWDAQQDVYEQMLGFVERAEGSVRLTIDMLQGFPDDSPCA